MALGLQSERQDVPADGLDNVLDKLRTNEASIERLVGSLLIEQHERWISGKVYLTMDTYWLERDRARTNADQIRQQLSKTA